MLNEIKPDADTLQLMADLEQGLIEAKAGIYARVHTPEMIAARQRGRPVGSTKADAKRQTALRLKVSTLERWRASGRGWQTRAAALLDQYAPNAVGATSP